MTDRELFWVRLKGPSQFAHETGQDMARLMNQKRLSKKRSAMINRLGDGYFRDIMQLFTVPEMARIVKTWLTVYDIPLDPDLLTTFTEYHILVGQYVGDIGKDLQPY
ncbi:MAG: hypothetical protein EBS53_16555 [Bacteroidetes bacterium]|nr:hypothetical protein [Bacteroidota bacterium]